MDYQSEYLPISESKSKKCSLWFHLHFWVGWIAAVPIALVCLTGALLVFEQDLFRWEHKQLFQLEETGNALSVQQVLEAYYSADPPLQVNHLGLPKLPEYAYSAFCTEIRPEGNRGAGRVFLNQYTGEIIRLSDGFSLSETFIGIHRRLVAGRTGQLIVAFSSLLLAITCLFGLVLWWPLRGRTFVRAWKRGQVLDWHNVLGLAAMMPLIIMAITGVMITWGRDIWPLVDKLQGYPSRAVAPAIAVSEGEGNVSMDLVVERVRGAIPGKRITGIQPGNGKNVIKVFLDADGNNLQLFIDPHTGSEVGRFDGSGTGPVGSFRKVFGSLHTLHPYGLFFRFIWGLFSLVGTVLVVTGVWVSIKRWRRQK